jgi:cyclopropane-fatty-acyl-phospholipid synthase
MTRAQQVSTGAAAIFEAVKQGGAPFTARRILRYVAGRWAVGELIIRQPRGPDIRLQGHKPGPHAELNVRDFGFMRRVVRAGQIGFAEGYMAGEWDSPDLTTLLETISLNFDRLAKVFRGNRLVRRILTIGHALNFNSRRGSRRNIAAHYDLGNDFYSLWLDPSMTYSSALYAGTQDLGQAQRQKYAALARAIGLRSGERVLEIGCGWGGFAEFAAKEAQAKVTAITISEAQAEFARARLQREGLNETAEVRLIDYRDMDGRFDRIASIEMFEAVGEAYWPTYFSKVRELLSPGGRAGLQIITIRDDLFANYRRQADFIQRFIFPGGMLPSEGRLRDVFSRAGLVEQGLNRFGADYARTLGEWLQRFDEVRGQVRGMGFDDRFIRMWRMYLAYCEAGFRTGRTNVGQWVLARS